MVVLPRQLLFGYGPLLIETELSTRPDLIRKLVPSHAEPTLKARGVDVEGFVPIPLEQLRINLDVNLKSTST